MRRARGFTLTETIIASGLMLLLTLCVFGFLTAGFRLFAASQVEVETHQSVLVALHNIETNLQYSDIRSVVINPANGGGIVRSISFLSGMDPGSGRITFFVADPNATNPNFTRDGFIIWRRRLVFYHNPTDNTLRLNDTPIATPTTDPSPYRTTSFNPSNGDRIIARNISALTFTGKNGASQPNSNPIDIAITSEKENVHRRPSVHRSSLRTSVVMDNGYHSAGGITLDPAFFQFQVQAIQPFSISTP